LPAPESYDYLSIACDWAWEGHRRRQSYQAEAWAHAATANITEHLVQEKQADEPIAV
jgi:hypothetical protein